MTATSQGLVDAKIGEIAQHSRAAKGTVHLYYLYFDAKEALYEAVVWVIVKLAFLLDVVKCWIFPRRIA